MIPSGQSWQAETTSSCYSSFFGPSRSFINLLFLPPAPLALSFCFLHLHWCTPSRCKPLCVALLNSCSSFKHPPLSIFHCGSLILALQLLLSLLSLLTPRRLHQTNCIIKVKSELELWTPGFSPQGKFPSGEATVYTGRCSHTGTQGNTLQHTCKYTWMCVCAHTKPLWEIFILSTSWAHFFFLHCLTSSLCILCAPTVDIVCPWPKSQDESYGRPFNSLVCSPGQNNNCSSGWTCQVSRRSRQNQECSTEANKAATISCPLHQSLRYDYGREKQR